eukprot:jgi/Undpi1/12395/HiC_scaffold_5.g02067.m1
MKLGGQAGTVGTPLYMSPETLKGQGHELVSDIWSLGCVLYELAMLTSPFAGQHLTMKKLFNKIVRADYLPVDRTSYSERLSNLVDHLLIPDPNIRPKIDMGPERSTLVMVMVMVVVVVIVVVVAVVVVVTVVVVVVAVAVAVVIVVVVVGVLGVVMVVAVVVGAVEVMVAVVVGMVVVVIVVVVAVVDATVGLLHHRRAT